MTNYHKLGIRLIVLGIAMFFIGGSFFTYQGPSLNPIISKFGEISLIFWLPTLIVGIIFLRKRKQK